MPVHIAGYGSSFIALNIRPGAIGTIVNILPEGAAPPSYVKFPRVPSLGLAAEVRYRRSENSAVMWKDFYVATMSGDETLVVIPRKTLDELEIEYSA